MDRPPATNRLNLAIGLPLQNQQELQTLLKQIYDPASPDYRHYLTPEQFTQRFGPSEKDYQAVMDFAKARGLTVTATHPNRMILDVEGVVTDIENVFRVTMRTYRHPSEARTFYAPDAEPSLDLPVPILHISGLDNYFIPHPKYHVMPAGKTANAAPNAGSGPGGAYAAGDFRAAYVPGTSLTGAGQTVGLLQFDGFYTNDIAAYVTQFGLPNIPVQVIPIDGGVTTPGSGNTEVCLDIETVMSMAPGVSKIYVYEAPNPSPWVDILSRMANDNLSKQLSCSWGGGGPDPTSEQVFQQMAAQGQSFFNACGDGDAYTGPVGFPADSPHITQVGGTTLTTSGPGGSYVSETVWNRNNGIGTGGGLSTYYSIPSYQQGINMTTNQGSTTMRNIPDVALTAENVYVTSGNGGGGSVGGTSCAAPLWAGFTALVNQQAAANSRPSVGFINPAIYTIGQGASYSSNFHDTTTGNNFKSSSPTKFPAVPGYDLCTGWGSPTGTNLIYALAGVPDALQVSSPTFAASGPPGGPFTPISAGYTLTNTGASSLTWTVSSTQTWMSLSATSGTLAAGDYTTVTWSINSGANALAGGGYNDTVTFSNTVTGACQIRGMTLWVGPPIITSTNPLASVTVGTPYNVALTANGGVPPYSWSLFAGSLPSGLSLSSAGVISGTPDTAAANSFTVQVAGNDGQSSTSNLSLTINAQLPPATNIVSGVTVNYAGTYMVGTNGPFNALIVTNAGVLTSSNGVVGNSVVSSNNYALVTGAGSLWSNSGSLLIGNTGSFNQLTISSAGHASSSNGYVGYDITSSNNSVLVSGASSVWSNSSEVHVGESGSGNSLTIISSGLVLDTAGVIGDQSSASNNLALVTGSGSLWSNSGALVVGYGGSGNNLTISNAAGAISSSGSIGYQTTSSNNSAVVTGSGSLWNAGSSAYFYLGVSGSSNSLIIANGGRVADGSAELGYNAGANNNSALVTDPGSLWSNANNLFIGNNSSSNTMAIINGGQVRDFIGTIGNNTGANSNAVLVAGAGSVWTNSGELQVGWWGAGNSLTITNGGQVFGGYAWVGANSSSSNNSVFMAGAGSVWSNSNLYVGFYAPSNQVTILNGAELVVGSTLYLGYGTSAYGNVLIASNAGYLASVGLTLGYNNSCSNSVTLENSIWNLRGGRLTWGSGTGAVGNILSLDAGSAITNIYGLTLGNSATAFYMTNTAVGFGLNGDQMQFSPSGAGSLVIGSGGYNIALIVSNYSLNASGLSIGAIGGRSNSVSLANSVWSLGGGALVLGGSNGAIGNSLSLDASSAITNIYGLTLGNSATTFYMTNAGAGFGLNGNQMQFSPSGAGSLIIGTGVFNTVLIVSNYSLNATGLSIGAGGGQSNSVSLANSVWSLGGGALVWGGGAGAIGNNLSLDASSAITNIYGLTLGDSATTFYMTNSAAGAVLNGFTTNQLQFSNGIGALTVGSGGYGTALIVSNYTQTSSGLIIGGGGGQSNSVTLEANSVWNLKAAPLVWGGGIGAFGNSLNVDSSSALTNISGMTLGDNNTTFYMTNFAGGFVLNGLTTNQLRFASGGFGALTVGAGGGTGTVLVISNYSLVTTSSSYIGSSASNNTVLLVGPGSLWSNSGTIYVGYNGLNNGLTIANAGVVAATNLVIGNNSLASNSFIALSGGYLYATNTAGGGALSINYGALNLNSGTAWVNHLVATNGANSAFSLNGGMLISGASLVSNGSAMVVGNTGTGATFTLMGTNHWFANGVTVGNSGVGSALMVTNGAGALSLGATIIGNNASASNNSILVTGASSFWNNSNSLTIGNSGSSNNLVISNGGQVFDTSGYLGTGSASSNNSAWVTDTGSVWSNTSSLWVGWSGSGNSLTIANGAHAFDSLGYIGVNPGANNNSVLVTGIGSLWTSSGFFEVGGSGSSNSLMVANGGRVSNSVSTIVGNSGAGNSLTISNSGQVFGTSAYIGDYTNTANNNYVTVTGAGSMWSNSSTLYVGYNGSSNSLTIANSGQVFNPASYIGYYASAKSNSVVVTGAGSIWSNNGTLYLGYYGASNSLTISNGGRAFTVGATVGSQTGSVNNSVMVAGTSSVWSNAGTINLGSAAGLNRMTVSSGGTVMTTTGIVGNASTSSNNTVLVTDGGSLWSNLNLTIGGSSAGNSLTIANTGNVMAASFSSLGAGTTASNNSVLITGLGSVWNAGSNLYVGNSGSSNSVTIASGGLLLDGAGYIGYNASSSNDTVWVTGAGSVWSNSGTLFVGYNGPNSQLNITNGGRVFNGFANIGNSSTSSNNVALVSGTGSLWSMANNLAVGNTGSNNLMMIMAGGQVVDGGGNIGNPSGNNNTVIVSDAGSLWSNSSVVNIGVGGSGNWLIITNGGQVIAPSAAIANNANSSNNAVLVAGAGSLWKSSGSLYVGNAGAGSNSLTIGSGGTVTATNVVIGATPSTGNVITISGGWLYATNATSSGSLEIRYGTIAFTGGNIVADTFFVTNNTASATNSVFSFNAGALTTRNGSQIVMPTGNNFLISSTPGQMAIWNVLGGTNTVSWAGSLGDTILGGTASATGVVIVSGVGTVWSNASDLMVGGSSAGNQLIVTNGGVLTVAGNGIIGNSLVSSSNSVWVTGLNSLWSMTNDLMIGMTGSLNTLTITNSGVVVSVGGVLGANNFANSNAVLVTGSGSLWNNQTNLYLGVNGSGNSLTLANGGRVFNSWAYIGSNSSSGNNTIIVQDPGSLWSNNRPINLGYSGPNNQLIVTNSGSVFASQLTIGYNSSSTNNYVLVTGTNSSLVTSGGGLTMGFGANNQLVIANGAFASNVSTYIDVGPGANNNAVLVTGSNSTWIVTGQLFVGEGGTNASVTVANGGRFSTPITNTINYIGSPSSHNRVLVTGSGSLWTNGSLLFIGSSGFDNSLTVTNGGTMISSRAVILGGSSGDYNNSLVVSGSGSLWTNGGVLMVGSNGYANNLTVSSSGQAFSASGFIGYASSNNSVLVTGVGSLWNNSGNLYAGNSGSSNQLTILSGGVVSNNNGYIGVNASSSNNAVLASGTGSLWNNGGNLYAGNSGMFNQLMITNGAEVFSNTGFVGYATGANSNAVLVSGAGSSWVNWYGLYVGSNGVGNSLTITGGGQVFGGIDYIGTSGAASNNAVLISGVGSLWNNGMSYVGYSSSGNSLTLANGGQASSGFDYIGNYSGANNNAVLVSGAGSVWNNSAAVYVGNSGASNSLTITGGGQVFNAFSSSYIGRFGTASNNTVQVSGSGSLWNNSSALLVGFLGSGNSLMIANSGQAFNTYGTIGNTAGANNNAVLVTGVGSLWSNNGDLSVGATGSFNSLTITNGGTVLNTNAYVGFAAAASNNTVFVGGANAVWTNTGALSIGGGLGNSVTLGTGGKIYAGVLSNLNGSVFSMSGGSTFFPRVYNAGAITQSGGLFDPAFYDNTGTLQITGGTNVDQVFLNEASGIVQQSGGEHDVNAATNFGSWTISGGVANLTNFINESHGALTVSGGVLNGSLTIGNTGSFNQFTITNGGVAAGSIGTLGSSSASGNNWTLVTGSGSLWSNSANLYVGNSGSGNNLTVANGGRVSDTYGTVGNNAGANSNGALVAGIGSLWSNSFDQRIGFSGSGNNLTLASNGQMLNVSGYIGYNASASNNSALVSNAGSVWSNSANLFVGNSGSGNNLTITNGGQVFDTYGTVGNNAGASNNWAVVTGLGSLWSNSFDQRIGFSGSGNNLAIANNGRVVNVNGYIGYNAGANYNSALVSGAGSAWSNTNDLFVGDQGLGNQLTITNGGQVFDAHGSVGYNAAANSNSVLVAGAGSVWSNSANLFVGFSGSFNNVTIANVGQVFSPSGYVGYNASGSNNSVLVSGAGSLWNDSGILSAGYSGSGNNLTIANGGQVFDTYASVGYNAGASNNSALLAGIGSLWSNSGDQRIGFSGSGNNLTLANNGQMLNVSGYIGYNAGASNNSVLVSDAGSVWSNSANLFVGNSGSGNNLTITNGGQVFDTYGTVGNNAGASNNWASVTGLGSLWSNSFDQRIGISGSGNNLTIADNGRVVNVNGYIGYNAGASNNLVIVTGSGSLWSNAGVLTIGQGGGPGNQVTLASGAQIDASVLSNFSGNIFSMSGGSAVFPLVYNAGTISQSGGEQDVTYATNSGAWTVASGGLLEVRSNLTINAAGGLTNFNGGDVRLVSNATVNVSGSLVITNAMLEFAGASTAATPFLPGVTFQNASAIKWAGYGGSFGSHAITGNLNLDLPSGPGLMNGIVDNASLTVGGGSGVLYVGSNNLDTLTITNGGHVSDYTGYIGFGASASNNSVLVGGAGSLWNNGYDFYVGNFGSFNQLTITNGGQVSDGLGYIGNNVGANNNTVLVTGTGSVWNTGLRVGNYGASNQLTVANGGTVIGYIQIGYAGDNNAMTVTGTGSVVNNTALELGWGSIGNQLTVANGARMLNSQNCDIGFNSGANSNLLTVTGAGSFWSNNNYMLVGAAGSFNQLTINSSARALNNGTAYVGYNASGSDNAVLVSGAGSIWTNNGDLDVGYFGSGNSLVIGSSGNVFNVNGYIGNQAGANSNAVSVTGASSVWNNSSSLFVGYAGSGNSLLLTNGGTVSATNIVVGATPSSTGNVVTVSGGSLYATNGGGGALNVLYGTLNMNSGTVAVDWLLLTNFANSVFNFNGGVLKAGQMLSTQPITVNGGTLSLAGSFVNLSGGTLQLNSGSVIVPGSVNNQGAFIQNGGLFDPLVFTNSGSFVLNSGTNMDGVFLNLASGVVQQSGGELDVNVATNYGSWAISGGVANLTNLVIDAGGVFTNAGGLLVSTNAAGTGTLDVRNGTFVLLSGTVTVNQFYATNLANSVVRFNGGTLNSGGTVVSNGSAFIVGDTGGGATLNLQGGSHLYANGVTVGNLGSGNGLVVANGAVARSLGTNTIGNNASASNNTVLVTGSGSLWSNSVMVFVGYYGSGNSLAIANGGEVSTSNGTVGFISGSANNSILVTGSGSVWTNNGVLIIGASTGGGGNNLTITNGGRVFSGSSSYIGNLGANNSVIVTDPGSLWNAAGSVYVGNGGSHSTLTIANGGQVISGAADLIDWGGSVLVTGPGSLWQTPNVNMGQWYVPGNLLTISNGGSVVSTSVVAGVFSSSTNNGIVVSGGSLYATNTLMTGSLDVRFGALMLNSGTVTVNHLYLTNGASSVINFNGGTLTSGGTLVNNGSAFTVGDTGAGAALNLVGGTHIFSNDLIVGNSGAGNSLLITNGAQAFVYNTGFVGYTAGASNNVVTVSGAGSVWSNAGNLYVGNASSGNQLTIANGGVVFDSLGRVGMVASASNNTVLISGTGSLWSNSANLSVGYDGSGNEVMITNGGRLVVVGLGYIGRDADAINNGVTVSGSGSLLTAGELDVGYNGTGNSLTIANASRVFNYTGYVGNTSSANNNTVLVTGAGSLWTNNVSLYVGNYGSDNSLSIAGGGQVISSNVTLGYDGGSSNNSLIVTGPGSQWSNTSTAVSLGLHGSSNALLIANGGVISDWRCYINYYAESTNNVAVVTGAGSLWTNTGSFYVGLSGSGGQLTVAAGGQLVNGGVGYVGYNSSASNNTVLVTDPGSRWVNTGSLAIGSNGPNSQLAVSNGGVVVAAGVTLGSQATSTNNFLTVSGGSVFATNTPGNATLDVRNGTLALLSGTVTVNQFYATNFANSVVNFNGGTLNIGGSTVNNGSIFQIGNGSSAATLDLFGGAHSFANGLFINTNAILTGTGSITGSITDAGLIAPGNGFGVITDTGSLTMLGGGAMTMELGGTNAWLYDQFDLTGALNFGGTLTLALLNGYTPQAGDQFNLFDFGNGSGAFSVTNLPTLSPALYWNTSLLYSTGVIEADQIAGSLQVILAPQAAIDAGAKWQVDADGNWHTNNETVGGLLVGSHTVSYTNLTGWIAPTNQTVQIATGVTTTNTGTYQLTPLLLAAVSRKTQGGAGTFDLNLNLNGTPSATVEPRLSGPTQLVFTFNKAMAAADGTLDATEFTVTNATFVSASIVTSNLTLNLTSVVDQSKVTVVMNGLTDMAGNPLSGTNAVIVRSLYGDVNQSGTVNAVDLQQVKNNLLTTLTPSNFLCDVNSSGTINAVDLQQIKNNLLHSASLVADSGDSTPSTLSNSLTASALATTTLGEALGATNLTWSTDGDAPWTATIAEDGSQAAWSGSIGNLNVSWVETTATGPGTLSFDWMVSSELNGDYLTFAIDGVNQPGAISGEAGWQTLMFNIPAGTHRLTWTYSKNGATASGLDAGWLRRVVYR